MGQKENNERIKAGNNLRGLLNDLKRRPEDAAMELNFPIEELNEFLEGKKMLSFEFISKACKKWPVNERDFFVTRDTN